MAFLCASRKIISHVTLLLFLVVLSNTSAFAQTAKHHALKSVAIVIGNGKYENASRLTNPVNDAIAVNTALEELGFKTILVQDKNKSDVEVQLNKFYKEISEADIILFYYAGHGVQVNGENYLVPIDFKASQNVSMKQQLISIKQIVTGVERQAKPGASKIFVLDACRDNPFGDLFHEHGQRSTKGLAPMVVDEVDHDEAKQPGGYFRIFAFATAPNKTASDGENGHSPYTQSLIKHIRQPGLEVKEMFVRIANDVQIETQGVQRPDFLVQTSKSVYFQLPNITLCDRLAIEGQNFLGIEGVPFDDVDAKKAIPACEQALKHKPTSARLNHNLARGYEKNQRLKLALHHYQVASDAGYPPAINALGIMYLAGCGMPAPNAEKGIKTIARAFDLGNLQARATLTSHDMLPHISPGDVKSLQRQLHKVGDYKGAIDGSVSPSLKTALVEFQKKKHLDQRGLSLATIHSLSLYEIVPEGFRCH